MTAFLKTLFLLTTAGTVCGLFLVLLRKVFKGKIPNSFLYVAWLVVMLRFVIPMNGLIPIGNSSGQIQFSDPTDTGTQSIYAGSAVTVDSASVSYVDSSVQLMSDQSAPYQNAPEAIPHVPKNISLPTVLFVLWSCGALSFFLRNMIIYIRFSLSLKKNLSKPLFSDIAAYDEVMSARRPELSRSGMVSAPLTFGLFAPVIVIPDIEYDSSVLKNVFRHEITHFRRHDILFKWVILFVCSVHWMNPFVWYFRKEIDKVCELSCDEILLKRMSEDEKNSYGETLLTIARNAGKTPYRMMTGFSEGKRDLKERLIQIMSFQKKSKIAIAIALVPVLLLCGTAWALGPKAETDLESKEVNVSDIDGFLSAIAPNTEIHLASGVYDLTKASNYGRMDSSEYYHWNHYGFAGQYELCIEKVDGLRIIGENAEILTVPRSSNVMVFRGCNQLFLRGLTVGHTEAAQACEGGVIRLENCADTVIDTCGLYGCGTIGVWAEGSTNLRVSDTDIYHCSAAGISFSDGMLLSVENCNIYDCGREEAYMGAAGAFLFNNASDVTVRNCDIHDNYLQSLIQGDVYKSTFDSINVHENHISSVLNCGGEINFSNMSFSSNIIDKWIGMLQNGTVTLDGKRVTEDELPEKWKEQLSSSGVGAITADYLTIDRSGTKEKHVRTADEFTAAIASDTTIYIDVPQINLTDCSDYGKGASAESFRSPTFSGKTYAWCSCFDGFELYIGNVSNLHIVGGEIVTQPRYANVLNYLNCSDITLDRVHLGHTPEQGNCSGGVLFFENTDDIIVEGCDLYGCGILGISTTEVKNLHVQDTLIHDCSYGAAVLEDSDNAVFLGCSVKNCPDPHFSLRSCTNFSWDRKLMDPYCSFNVNNEAKTIFEETQPNGMDYELALKNEGESETRTIVNVACIVVNAYVKGYEGFEKRIESYLSRTSAIGAFSEITPCDFPVYYETSEGIVPAEEMFPARMVQTCRMDGPEEITGEEPEGTKRSVVIYFRTSLDHPEQESSFFKVDLILEDGCWRVVRF